MDLPDIFCTIRGHTFDFKGDWGFRGGSRGRVPEMTCGFLIQLVFCEKKNYVVYWC